MAGGKSTMFGSAGLCGLQAVCRESGLFEELGIHFACIRRPDYRVPGGDRAPPESNIHRKAEMIGDHARKAFLSCFSFFSQGGWQKEETDRAKGHR